MGVFLWARYPRNVKRFRGGLVLKAHRWLKHSTLGSRVMKKKKKEPLYVRAAGRRLRVCDEEPRRGVFFFCCITLKPRVE